MGTTNDLSDRMKRYEESYKFILPPRAYVIVRCDGKNFSKLTKYLNKPFDMDFSASMDETAVALCEEFNPKFAYCQSDEISMLFTDIDNINASQMFDGKVQKICSLTAAKASVAFNHSRLLNVLAKYEDENVGFLEDNKELPTPAIFDSRVFIIPDVREVSNYFIHRQQDCTRNSI